MPYTEPSLFTFNASNSQPNNPILSAEYNANFQNCELSLSETRSLGNEIKNFVEVLEIANYIRDFLSPNISFGVNAITIASDAVIAWNNALKSEVAGWGAKTFDLSSNPTEMANNFVGFLWITWDGGSSKDYSITSKLAQPVTNGYLLGSYSIDGAGTVTFTKHVARFWETTAGRFTAPFELYGGVGGNTKYAPFFYESNPPVWLSNSTFSIAYSFVKDDTNVIDIDITTSKTLDISTTGLLGVCQSANLTGTVTANSGASTVVGVGTTFTTDFIVGDVIRLVGGQARRITVITDNLNLTVESNWGSTETGVTYKRGGEAPSTVYYIYAVLSSSASSYVLSTRNSEASQTVVDLPSGILFKRRLKSIQFNNVSSNLSVAIDDTILIDTTAGSTTFTLYTAVGNAGKRLTLQNIGTTQGNRLTIDGAGSETINGALKWVLFPNKDRVTIESDGTNWRVIEAKSRVLIEEWTPTATTSKNFVFGSDIDSNQFASFELEYSGLSVATTANGVYSRLSVDGGSTFISSTAYSNELLSAANTILVGAGADNTSIQLSNTSESSAFARISGKLELFSATVSSIGTGYAVRSSGVTTTPAQHELIQSGYFQSTGVIGGIQIYTSAGNFGTTGNVKVFGVRG